METKGAHAVERGQCSFKFSFSHKMVGPGGERRSRLNFSSKKMGGNGLINTKIVREDWDGDAV